MTDLKPFGSDFVSVEPDVQPDHWCIHLWSLEGDEILVHSSPDLDACNTLAASIEQLFAGWMNGDADRHYVKAEEVMGRLRLCLETAVGLGSINPTAAGMIEHTMFDALDNGL